MNQQSTRALQCAAVIIATAASAGLLAWYVSGLPTAQPDFAMLWMGTQLANPYDQRALMAALNRGSEHAVAFMYPPSSLPILAPFAWAPFRSALVAWVVISGAAMAAVSRSKWSPLLILTPAVLWALPGGQTSVLLGSLLFGSLQLLSRRPMFSGVLLGIAVALKPQFALILPIAFLIERKWVALAAAGVTFFALCVASAVMFGLWQWPEWAHAVPAYLTLHADNPALRHNEIAFGLPLWLRGLCLIGGAWLTVRSLRNGDPLDAFVTSVGLALIASAHAMGYEFAMFAPAYFALASRRGWSSPATALFILAPLVLWAFPPLIRYMPRLIALVALIAGTVADTEIRLRNSKRLSQLSGNSTLDAGLPLGEGG